MATQGTGWGTILSTRARSEPPMQAGFRVNAGFRMPGATEPKCWDFDAS